MKTMRCFSTIHRVAAAVTVVIRKPGRRKGFVPDTRYDGLFVVKVKR